MKGKFITFEGCDGSGKSTQLSLLEDYLNEHNIPHIMTREPGGSRIAEAIRKIILDGKNIEMCDECEALLYAAARAQHLKEVVAPALEEGKLVVCDRYVHSSIAYQGFARGLGQEFVTNINALALEHYMPDLTIFLDISPEEAFARKRGADQNDRLELSGMDFHNRVYQGYCALKGSQNFEAIDCRGTRQETQENVMKVLKEYRIV